MIFFTISIKGFKFQPNVFNQYHDLLMMSINLSGVVVLNNKSSDCCCIISGTSKSEAINILQNIDLIEEGKTLENIKPFYHIKGWKNKFKRFHILKLKKI